MNPNLSLSERELNTLQYLHNRMLSAMDAANRRNLSDAVEAVDRFFIEVDNTLKRHASPPTAAAS